MSSERIYIELGGGSAAKSLAHRTELRHALRAGVGQLKKQLRLEDARIVGWLLTREWNQERTPYYAWVSKAEYRALSRALRAEAYGLAAGTVERERGLLGADNVPYKRFRWAVQRSKQIAQQVRQDELRAGNRRVDTGE